MNPPVFILSLFDTGVYAARLLRKTGVVIYGFDHDQNNPGFYSKYIISFIVPQPQDDPKKLFEILLEKQQDFDEKPILIAASENYLEFIFRYREALKKYFNFLLPQNEILGNIINKSSQLKLAENCEIHVPFYRVINSSAEIDEFGDIDFPLLIKGVDQPRWRSLIKKKTIVAEDKFELLRIGNDLLNQNISFILQKIVSGDCSNNFEYNALLSNGKIIEHSVNQKIRQYPIDFGYGCCVQTVSNPEVEKLGARFVTKNKIEGFSNTEFKLDPETGIYYYIETNARVWQQVELTNKSGQNFVLAYYNLLSNNQYNSKPFRAKPQLRWVDLPTDLLVFVKYRHQIKLGIFEFIKSTLIASNYGLFSLKDIRPFLKSIGLIK